LSDKHILQTMGALNFPFKINSSVSTLLLRLVLGVVFFAWRSDGTLAASGLAVPMGFSAGTLYILALFAFLAIAAQFARAIALILGLFTRVAALAPSDLSRDHRDSGGI
jgi:putative oxidoreductase